jgi:hypothetical protein
MHLVDRVRELVVLSVTGGVRATYERRPHAQIAPKQGVPQSGVDAYPAVTPGR